MPSDHSSYIKRASDHDLAEFLRDPEFPCIAINGDSEFGKSSLMNRVASILSPAETVVFMDATILRTDLVDRCVDRFLAYFPRAMGNLRSLTELAHRTAKRPVVVLMDDFDLMGTPAAKVLLPDLLERVIEASGKLRVVVTLIGDIGPTLEMFGVTRLRHFRVWKTVHVERFHECEAKQFLSQLPDAARTVTERMFGEIQERSNLKPRRLQCLADQLWHAHQQGENEAHLAALVSRPDSYE